MNNIDIVTASAGSGKTTKVIDLLAGYLIPSGGSYGYSPREMIVTTFTRAAAGELRERARKKMMENGELKLAVDLDQAMIGTVNSVCGRLLELYSFEAGISPVIRVITDEEKEVVFQKALSSVLGGENAVRMSRFEEIFSMTGDEIRSLVSKTADLIRINRLDKEDNSGNDPVEASIRLSKESLGSVLDAGERREYRTLLGLLRSEIPAAIRRAKDLGDSTGATSETISNLETLFYKILQEDEENLEDHSIPWYEIGRLCEPKMGAKSAEEGVFDVLIREFCTHVTVQEFHEDLLGFIEFLFKTSNETLIKYQELKKERGLIDFVDQEVLLLDLLDERSESHIREDFARRFKVLIVDEFQDTSPLQLALFMRIAELVGKVIWVGDPKQAIYGFRGTDSSLISRVLAYKREHSTGETERLKTSFRSRESLVSLVNNIFPVFFKKDENGEPFLEAEQVKLTADRTEEKKGLGQAFQVWASYFTGKGSYYPNIQARHLAMMVKVFKENQGIMVVNKESPNEECLEYCDIAILCRTNSSCDAIAFALRKEGIPASIASSGLHKTAEFRLFSACLKYFDNAYDDLALAEISFLAGTGHNMEELLEQRLVFLGQKNGDADKEWIHKKARVVKEKIDEQRAVLNGCTVSAIARVLHAVTQMDELVSLWGETDQRRANLEKIISSILKYEEYAVKLGFIPSFSGFLEWFSVLGEANEDECGIAFSKGSVNVLTYHKAKGLEWPVVIMNDLDYTRDPDVFSVKTWQTGQMDITDPLSGRLLHYWPWPYQRAYGKRNGFKGFDSLVEKSEFFSVQEHKENLEKIRLLYVGMTRARDYLVFPFAFNVKTEKNKESFISFELKERSFLSVIMPNGIKDLISEFPTAGDETITLIPELGGPNKTCRYWGIEFGDLDQDELPDEEIVTLPDIPYFTGVKQLFWRNPSKETEKGNAQALHYRAIHTRMETQHAEGEGEEEGAFGTCIHRILCAVNERMADTEISEITERLMDDFGFAGILTTSLFVSSVKSFYAWLSANFPDATLFKEYPLMMEKEGQMMKGIADLVVETPEKVILVDYKTFAGKPDPEKNRESCEYKARSYGGQLSLYGEILEKVRPGKPVETWIWFVIAGSVVEIKTQ